METKRNAEDLCHTLRREGLVLTPAKFSNYRTKFCLFLHCIFALLIHRPILFQISFGQHSWRQKTGSERSSSFRFRKFYHDKVSEIIFRLLITSCFIPEFKSGRKPLLIATDVASRGIGLLLSEF